MAWLILKFPVLLFLYMHECYRFSCQGRLTTSLHQITLRHSDRHHKPVIFALYPLMSAGFGITSSISVLSSASSICVTPITVSDFANCSISFLSSISVCAASIWSGGKGSLWSRSREVSSRLEITAQVGRYSGSQVLSGIRSCLG